MFPLNAGRMERFEEGNGFPRLVVLFSYKVLADNVACPVQAVFAMHHESFVWMRRVKPV